MEADRFVQDARENVRSLSYFHRKRSSPNQYTGYMTLMIKLVETEPSSFKEAIEKPVWVDARVEEYESIVKNSVWEVITRLKNESVVGLRWILKVKHIAYGSIEKYKARFVVKAYFQVEGIHYEETFAPICYTHILLV